MAHPIFNRNPDGFPIKTLIPLKSYVFPNVWEVWDFPEGLSIIFLGNSKLVMWMVRKSMARNG